MMDRSKRVRFYSSYDEDMIETADQSHTVPQGYRWVRSDMGSKIAAALSYGTALVLSSVWCRLHLHLRIRGREALRQTDLGRGAFIYGNHTQPVGDVFIPALAAFPRRIYTVVSPSNLGIPVIGKILPYLGALPIPSGIAGMRHFTNAVEQRSAEGNCVVVYPEAHVWEYCTEIRPMAESAFSFPIKDGLPSFAMTTTYQRRRHGKRPKAVVYIDGPFYPDDTLPPRRRAGELCARVRAAMEERAKLSDVQYIKYEKKDADDKTE